MAVAWTRWRPRLLYGGFFLLAFLFGLRQTFPAEAVKERLMVEAGQRGWKLEVGEVGPAGLLGVGMRDVTVKQQAGVPVPLEALDVTFSPWALLRGRRSIGFDAHLWDGRVRGQVELSAEAQAIDATLERLDLARALPLRAASGLDLEGLASGAARVTLPTDAQGKATGTVEVTVTEAGITGGKVPVPGMAGALTVPRLSLGQVTAALTLADGKGTVNALTSRGGDLEVTGDGLYFVVQPRLEHAPVYGKLQVRLASAFTARPEGRSFAGLLDGVLSQAKGPDGSFQFQVYGSLGHPLARALGAGAR
jgi:type II secretion system protein N